MKMMLDYDSDRLPRVIMSLELADLTFMGHGETSAEAAEKLVSLAEGHMTLEELMTLGKAAIGV